MNTSGIIYYHDWDHPAPHRAAHPPARSDGSQQARRSQAAAATASGTRWSALLGLGMVALALGGLAGPMAPRATLEAKYAYLQVQRVVGSYFRASQPQQVAQSEAKPAIPAAFDPLKTPDGGSIEPVNREFSLVIPKIGVNAAVLPSVNPTKPGEYLEALKKGIAHSSLSYFPDEDGTVYLFSHSTNYEWFVGDLNAVFYLLKNLEVDDTVVIFYKGSSYTYKITGKQVVDPSAVSYMAPQAGGRKLILQTCWPPGSITERLLIFADLVAEQNQSI